MYACMCMHLSCVQFTDASDAAHGRAHSVGEWCFCVNSGTSNPPLTTSSPAPPYHITFSSPFNWIAMPPAAVPAPPPVARTTFTYVAGDYTSRRPPLFDIAEDSPLITSLPFLPWIIQPAGSPTRVPRSSLVGAIIMATRRPTDAELATLTTRSFLSTEMLAASASAYAHRRKKRPVSTVVSSTRV